MLSKIYYFISMGYLLQVLIILISNYNKHLIPFNASKTTFFQLAWYRYPIIIIF